MQYSFLEKVYSAPSSSAPGAASAVQEPFIPARTRVYGLAKRHCETLYEQGFMTSWKPNTTAAAPPDMLPSDFNNIPSEAYMQEAAAWLASQASQVVPKIYDKAQWRWNQSKGIKPSPGLQWNCTLCSNATFYVYFRSCNASDLAFQGVKPVEYLVRSEVMMTPVSKQSSDCLWKWDQSIEIFNKYIALPLAMGFVVIVILLTWIPGICKWVVRKMRTCR